jgi:cytidine deaminase
VTSIPLEETTTVTDPMPTLPMDPDGARPLLAQAREARSHAYAPYSRFPVGAALLADDGRVFTGCNVENASYGLTICAERVAVGKAVSEGVRRFRAVAVVGPEDDAPCAPCGACRQVLLEFGAGMVVVTPDPEAPGGVRIDTAGGLLPDAFGPGHLPPGEHGG